MAKGKADGCVIKKCIGRRWCGDGVRKGVLIKGNMARNKYFPGCWVKATIPTEVRRVPEKDTSNGSRMKFMWLCSRGVGVTCAPKNAKVVV